MNIKIEAGSIIFYKLDPETQVGTNMEPDRIWVGECIRSTIGEPTLIPGVIVNSLEPGYEGDLEWVPLSRIISYAKREAVQDYLNILKQKKRSQDVLVCRMDTL